MVPSLDLAAQRRRRQHQRGQRQEDVDGEGVERAPPPRTPPPSRPRSPEPPDDRGEQRQQAERGQEQRPLLAQQLAQRQRQDEPDHRVTRYSKTLSSDSSSGRISKSEAPAACARPRGPSRRTPPGSFVRTTTPPVRQLDAEHALLGHERLGQLAVVARPDGEGVGAVGHELADGAEVARGGQPSRHDHEHVLPQPLDLLEDVRGEEDRAPLLRHAAQQGHHLQPLARVPCR